MSRRDAVLALAIVGTLATAIAYKLWWPMGLKMLLRDGRAVESAQALLFAAAAVFSFLTARAARSRLHTGLFGLLALGLLLVAGEEISWGQQAFGFATPEWIKPHNRQRELTLHNLHRVQPTLRWAMLAVTGYAVLGRAAVLALARLRKSPPSPTGLLVTTTLLEALCFLPGLLWILLVHLQVRLVHQWGWTWAYIGIDPREKLLVWKDQEVPELLIALGFAAFALHRWRLVRERHNEAV